MRERVRLMGLVAAEIVLVRALHQLGRLDGFSVGWSDLSGWFENAPYEEVAGAAVLLAALLIAYWLLFSTVAYLIASASGRPKALGAVGWLTLPPVRGLVNRAVALSIAASAVTGWLAPAFGDLSGGAVGGPVIMEADQSGRLFPPGSEEPDLPGNEDSSEIIVPPHLEPSAPAADEPRPDEDHSPAVEGAVDGSVVHAVTVRWGDHLWSLSERHLSRILDRSDLGEHEIARYWVRVIEANRGTIRSGNPDLIYPGEVITLPAVSTTP